jgi:hypothetical protein
LYEIVEDFTHDIFKEKEGPFVSIYQNVHKSPSETQQDIIQFKNHLKTVESSLKEKYEDSLIHTILDQIRPLKEEKDFWNTNREAIAIFVSRNDYVVFRLNRPVKDKAIVADSFHIKPLIRYFQTRGTFDVLALNRESFTLYTCTQDTCHEVAFEPDTPITKEEVLGDLDEEGYLSHASYNGASGQAMYHGHEDNKDIIEKDTERYFRYVDHFINDTYSKPTNRPLVLWALTEHQGEFRKVTKNAQLIENGVKHSDKELTEDKVRKEAWAIVQPEYKKEIQHFIDKYEHALSKGLASDNINEIGKKAIAANIETAIIQSEKTIAGKLNKEDGTIIQGKIKDPMYDDVLDDLAEVIYQQGGKVIVLDEEEMPTDKGIAAIFRY